MVWVLLFMRKKKYYTFIISEGYSSNLKTFTVEKKYIHIFLGVLCSLFLLLTIFFTDYLGLHVDKWALSQLKQENKELQKKFTHIDYELKDLEKRIHKISDFSKKLQLVTNASPEQISGQMGFGKIHSSSAIVALSRSEPESRGLSSLDGGRLSSFGKKEEMDFNPENIVDSNELEVRIKELKGKSELVKQSVWTLYTDLLEKQEILNNTPSILPVKGWISSDFGYRNETILDHEPYFHRGMDIASVEGSPVVSTADGKVTSAGYDKDGYGYLVVIDHGYGLQTYYAHLKEIKTKKDEYVQRGQIIGTVGDTGKSTGYHLHYEVRMFNIPVNPDKYILDQTDFHLSH